MKEDENYTDIRSGQSLEECESEIDILMCYDEDIQRQVAQRNLEFSDAASTLTGANANNLP